MLKRSLKWQTRSSTSGTANLKIICEGKGDFEMPKNKLMAFVILTFSLIALAISFLPGAAQEKIEGTVVSTNLTACSVVPGKLGTCEGTLVLESKKEGKPYQTTVKVTRDTALKKGDEKLFLFQLNGAPVTVTFFEGKSEKVAQSVVTKGR
jgi:hypothetical protein